MSIDFSFDLLTLDLSEIKDKKDNHYQQQMNDYQGLPAMKYAHNISVGVGEQSYETTERDIQLENDEHQNMWKQSNGQTKYQRNKNTVYVIVSVVVLFLLVFIAFVIFKTIETRNSVKIEGLKNDMRKQLEEKIKYKLEQEKKDIKIQIMKGLQQQIKEDLKRDLKKQFDKSFSKALQINFKKQLQQSLKKDLQEIKKELEGNFQSEIENRYHQTAISDDQKIIQLDLPQNAQRYDNHQVSMDSTQHKPKPPSLNHQNLYDFKRILWLQTEYPLQVNYWPNVISVNSYIDAAKADGFEVRIVNNLNAYDWLSNETTNFIKKIRHTSNVDISVYELLRLAILYEHGGVSIRVPNIILMDGIGWVNDLIQGNIKQAKKSSLYCQLNKPLVVMLHKDTKNGIQFIDDIIIARPKSKIFITLLNEIAKISQEGVWPYTYYNVLTLNPDTQVFSFPGIVQALLNIYQVKNSNLCQQFGLQSLHGSKNGLLLFIQDKNSIATLNETQQSFQRKYGKTKMLWIRIANAGYEILQVIRQRNIDLAGESSLLKTKLMMAQGNKWLTAPPKTHRKVHFCIVSLKPQNSQGAQRSAKDKEALLGKQSFGSWNLVHFVNGLPSASKKVSERTVLVNASVYEGLNLQRAVTKHCRNDSVVFLLDYDETLTSETDLQTLAKQLEPIGNFAAFLKVKTNQKFYQPKHSQNRFYRRIFQINRQVLSDLANSLRAFTAQSYLLIPYFSLCHATTGRYFDREIAFMALIQFHGDAQRCTYSQQNYFMFRRLERLIDFPRRKVISQLTINSNHVKVVNTTGYQYYAKFKTIPLCQSIERFWMQLVNIDNLVVFNNGKEVKGLDTRKSMPELIPRKIHQVWIKGKIPAFKQFLMKRLRVSHPNYQYFLWTEDNITRQNFPESYDIMQTLLRFDKKSPYNKMSMLSDFIRHEAAYIHGGFYFDTNYMLLNNFNLDSLLTFSFVAGTDEIPLNRADRNSGFFGVSPRNPRMYRLINHRMLSSRRYLHKSAQVQTGPGLFGHSLVGDQELDQTVFLASIQQLYPTYHEFNKCQAPLGTPASEILFETPSRKYLKNCSAIYPYAIGLDFFGEGASWMWRRW